MKKKFILITILILIVLFIVLLFDNKNNTISDPKYSETTLFLVFKNNKIIKNKDELPKDYNDYVKTKLDFSKNYYIFDYLDNKVEVTGIRNIKINSNTITVTLNTKNRCPNDDCDYAFMIHSYLIEIDKKYINNNISYKIVNKFD